MHSKTSSLKTKLLKAAVPLALACAFTAAPAMAKTATTVPAAAPQITAEQQHIAQRIGAIQQELAGIRSQTLQAHPELVKELKAYETAFNNKVKAMGYQPEKLIKRAQEIQLEARKEGLSNAKRTELVKEFAGIRTELAKQQRTILSDPAISKQDKQVQQDVITAMKKQDPKASKLLAELDGLVKQFKKS
ncbi:hypothetical protein [Photobacterium leiognathi]|uniref:Uncharacterized protein n=2 Tax=Photobacterium leiognathi TaxID=553611 RepID=A0A2T3MAX2_PHOLE|nr:hypothetical protein [Photobacterium leiognathi]KJF97314.1 hypothetical protein UB34_13470 [Photobacterium leiognathi]MCG3886961.1 hypothetical protein [Photobacterium leiognathi]PSU94822.1 hypothetical protein C0W80_19000 [Photobacterium leiognathi subsp. mandapamensis]PSV10798.1 hypothetical protein C0W93_10845 [Photobacterium leiognathi subsp. mandapamensis]PSV90265.1 hypothetical protein CTM89_10300 [Photobacterium leiognathi]